MDSQVDCNVTSKQTVVDPRQHYVCMDHAKGFSKTLVLRTALLRFYMNIVY